MLETYDAVLISTDHDDVDYAMVVEHSKPGGGHAQRHEARHGRAGAKIAKA
jgi:hypothetical protein